MADEEEENAYEEALRPPGVDSQDGEFESPPPRPSASRKKVVMLRQEEAAKSTQRDAEDLAEDVTEWLAMPHTVVQFERKLQEVEACQERIGVLSVTALPPQARAKWKAAFETKYAALDALKGVLVRARDRACADQQGTSTEPLGTSGKRGKRGNVSGAGRMGLVEALSAAMAGNNMGNNRSGSGTTGERVIHFSSAVEPTLLAAPTSTTTTRTTEPTATQQPLLPPRLSRLQENLVDMAYGGGGRGGGRREQVPDVDSLYATGPVTSSLAGGFGGGGGERSWRGESRSARRHEEEPPGTFRPNTCGLGVEFYLSLPPPWNVLPQLSSVSANEVLKISTPSLPQFDGTPSEYLPWRDSFIPCVHRTTVDVTLKVLILRKTLTPGSRSMRDFIRNIIMTAAGYRRAIELLEERYGGLDSLLLARQEALLSLPEGREGEPITLETLPARAGTFLVGAGGGGAAARGAAARGGEAARPRRGIFTC